MHTKLLGYVVKWYIFGTCLNQFISFEWYSEPLVRVQKSGEVTQWSQENNGKGHFPYNCCSKFKSFLVRFPSPFHWLRGVLMHALVNDILSSNSFVSFPILIEKCYWLLPFCFHFKKLWRENIHSVKRMSASVNFITVMVSHCLPGQWDIFCLHH